MLHRGSEAVRDYARIWRAADKVVFSRTLERPSSGRTRIEREFDPDDVRRLKEGAAEPLSIGGPELAGQALRGGLVDEIRLILAPVIVGAGTSALPDDVHLALDLLEQRRFANGMVYLRYAVRNERPASG
jgi:dihydrofolate reductase